MNYPLHQVSPQPRKALPSRASPCERRLRTALDRTFLILGAAENKRHSSLLIHLEEMRREVVHFSMRVIAFHSSLETLRPDPGFIKNLPVIDSVLKTLGDAARSVAITLITHRPGEFRSHGIRLQRCGNHSSACLTGNWRRPPATSPSQVRARARPHQREPAGHHGQTRRDCRSRLRALHLSADVAGTRHALRAVASRMDQSLPAPHCAHPLFRAHGIRYHGGGRSLQRDSTFRAAIGSRSRPSSWFCSPTTVPPAGAPGRAKRHVYRHPSQARPHRFGMP